MNPHIEKNTEIWPPDGLESVPCCPICESKNRVLLHKGLVDKLFFCAPGLWDMHQCSACKSAYLDPRPSASTIGIAYKKYFTHTGDSGFSSLSKPAQIRRRLANGYRNVSYGTNDYPASRFGSLAALLMPNGKAELDTGMRHLPKIGTGKRILDLGCGRGDFLLRAQSAGWEVVGVDLDIKAVKAAQKSGIDVCYGDIGCLNPSEKQFDVITLAHVIEHVHNPLETLRACYRLLKPGGFLWLDTPNIASQGHEHYGQDWQALDAPRHLVLFTHDSMKSALTSVGFGRTEEQAYRRLCHRLFKSSLAISKGLDPYAPSGPSVSLPLVARAEWVARRQVERREFITMKAWKVVNV